MYQPIKEMIFFKAIAFGGHQLMRNVSKKKDGDLGQVNQGVFRKHGDGFYLAMSRAESFCYLFSRTQNYGGAFLNCHCFPGAQGSGEVQRSHLKLIYFVLMMISILLALHICIYSNIYYIALMCF